MSKSSYQKYLFPALGVVLAISWISTVTYLVQTNTPESYRTHLSQAAIDKIYYGKERGGGERSIASVPVKDDPLLKEAYSLGLNAYLWGSTLVRMENIARTYTDVTQKQPETSYRAPLNEFGHSRRLPGPTDTDMPTANQDTLYSSAVLDLNQSPMVLSVPAIKDRYYVIDVFDMWHNLIKYVGTRATGTNAQKYLIVAPNTSEMYKNNKGLSGLTIIESPTSKVWLWGRTQILKSDDMDKELAEVHKIQDNYKLTELDEYLGNKKRVRIYPLEKRIGSDSDPLRFFQELGEYIKVNPVTDKEKALFGQFKKIGLTKDGFKKEMLSQAVQDVLVQVLNDGPQVAAAQIRNPANTKFANGWSYVFGLDNFGDDYALRSMVSHPYLGGQGEKEALYPLAEVDIKGNKLTGSKMYRIRFKSEPKVGAFWSVTVYDSVSKMLIKNDLERYSLNNSSNLTKKSDGSFDLYLSNRMPMDEKQKANWLATPKGNFYVIMRLYIPSKEILDSKWKVPGIEPVEPKVISMK
ncbi:DUF1254 domain-containing protein [Halobacteriovorax sp. HFRX-2_2]|uniref:DUF1254 domain-containing protein n=1 Tax=unclassified Halobacteriovorax TaxID=2639665 RepID=UPI00371331EA